jgi:iron complex outermembrane receptor protein
MSLRTRLLAGGFACICSPAFAQGPVETIIVTGQRTADDAPAASVTAGDAAVRINAVNTEDLLRYAPDLLVRKRHIGDTQDPIATRTSGIGQSARSLIYADGMLLSSPIGNNNSAASPHWGLVAPQDVASLSILYGPFSARYPGGSMGAVVEITTRMPDSFEQSGKALAAWQSFSQYGTRGDYGAYQLQSEIGDRSGPWAWRLSIEHLDSRSQPLSIVTLNRSASPGAAGTPVTGGIADVNRTGAAIAIIGAGGFEHQIQDTPSLKTTYDFTDVQLAYTASLFHQDDTATAQSYLKDASGAPIYSGSVNIGGYSYTIPASAFSNTIYRWNQTYLAQGLSLKSIGGDWRWKAAVSRFDYLADSQRVPTVALPTASTGGAGTITKMTGTNWTTADADADVTLGDHALAFGAHGEIVALDQNKFNTADWIGGTVGALASRAAGRTSTTAVWLEDGWAFAPNWRASIGLRLENWRAYDGVNISAAPALNVVQPSREGSYASPKLALRWQADDTISVTASYGTAFRMPTVTELYQTVTTGPTLTSPNPNLRPEHADSFDVSAVYALDGTRLRVSLFEEDIADALISQTAPLNGSSTLFSYVQNIDKVRSRGAEAVLQQTLGEVELQGSVTYVDSRIVKDTAFAAATGKATPQIPRWRTTASATWHASDTLDLSLAARYESRLYANIDNSDTVTHTWQGFDSFFVMDARARYNFDSHWAAAIGVDNLNNDRYFLFHPFPQRTVTLELSYAP